MSKNKEKVTKAVKMDKQMQDNEKKLKEHFAINTFSGLVRFVFNRTLAELNK